MYDFLNSIAHSCLQTQFGVSDADLAWEHQEKDGFGDIATAVALKLTKQVGKPPREIAEALVAAFTQDERITHAEVAGPGYVNITFSSAFLVESLNSVPETLRSTATRTDEQPVIVEYSSPNIAKPFGIHHILTTVIGQVLANLYRYDGFNTISINHIGDWGTQFGKLYVAYEQFGTKPLEECSIDDLLALYVQFHDEAEQNAALEDQGRAAFKQLEEGNAAVAKFWKIVVDITMKELRQTFEQLHVEFDHELGESFYEDKMEAVVNEGVKKGIFTEGERGALITEFDEDTHLPPAIIKKADGATIYMTRDIATARYRLDTWNPQKILHVVGAEQKLYFEQLIAIVSKLGWSNPLEHIWFGRMRFKDGDMSTRRGKVLKLQDVLDEAVERAQAVIESHGDSIQTDDPNGLARMMGQGAVVYSILSQNRKMDFTFDWDSSLSFEGNSAPYLQYTHARARSILRRAENEGFTPIPNFVSELTPKERALLRTLSRWDQVITQARESHLPHLLCTYLYTLCQAFNSFYSVEPILEADDAQKVLRLNLCYLTAQQLRIGAELLTLEVPDKM